MVSADPSMGRPKLSVAIVAYKAQEHLKTCLGSLYTHLEDFTPEVVLVDNHSLDGTLEMVRSEFPQVAIIENSRNLGVAPARNQALARARGDHILILDADTEILSGDLGQLFRYFENHPKVGLIGCRLLYPSGEIQTSARTFPRPVHVLARRLSFIPAIKGSRTLARHHLADLDLGRPLTVDFVEGAFQLIKREALEKVGLLDGEMFYGHEDVDFCARLQQDGYEVVYFPGYEVRHHRQALTWRNPFTRITWYHLQSYRRFWRKHGAWLKGRNGSNRESG